LLTARLGVVTAAQFYRYAHLGQDVSGSTFTPFNRKFLIAD
jgi:hypothetical protein